MRFLVDANVPREIGRFLRERGHDALVVRDSHLARASDRVLWAVAAREDRIVVTHDKDFPLRGVSGLPAGVIVLRPRDQRPAAVLELFRAFWSGVRPAEIVGLVVSVQVGRYRTRPLG